MAHGGARNRSGPQKDPNSLRSKIGGFSLIPLPSEGYRGDVPDFPLPDPTDRELAIWQDAWTTPQACAWAGDPWRWQVIGEYARWKALCESNANAALIAQLNRYRDQIGLTPAGLKENGWMISTDELASKRQPSGGRPARSSARDRLQVVQSDGA